MTPCSDDCERVLVLETGREMAASTLLPNPNRHRARITISSSRVRIQNRWRATCSRNQTSNKSKDPDKGKTTTKTLTPVTCSYKTLISSLTSELLAKRALLPRARAGHRPDRTATSAPHAS